MAISISNYRLDIEGDYSGMTVASIANPFHRRKHMDKPITIAALIEVIKRLPADEQEINPRV